MSRKRKWCYLLVGLGAGLMAGARYGDRLIELSKNTSLAPLKKQLVSRWGEDAAERILSDMKMNYAELLEEGAGSELKGIMRIHLGLARWELSLYRALQTSLDAIEDPGDEVHQLLFKGYLEYPIEKLAGSDRRIPFDNYRKMTERIKTHVFPAPHWEMTDVEIENGFGFDITGCFWLDFFREHGAPELTPGNCSFDWDWAPPPGSGIKFQRSTTLAEGAPCCDFRDLEDPD